MHSRGRDARGARRFGNRLHRRIWLAVLAGLFVAALLAGAVWRWQADDAPREIVLTDPAGVAVGRASLEFHERPGAVRVELDDGRVLYARWRGAGAMRPAFGFIGWLLLIVLAVGAGAYPVVRRLTRRLEQLQSGVDALGEGDLSARVAVRGHDEIAYLAARFNHAAARIEQLVNAHRSLLANASHELRSPLARIRMAMELIERGETVRAREEIARDIAELDALIEEILLASRLAAQVSADDPFEALDLTALAAEECTRAGAAFEAEGVIVTSGSTRLLRRAIRNLIENALRHGGGSAPEVRLARRDQAIVLAVCDRGPGIPQAERERIFEPFYRLKGGSETDGGSGLGLALVRSIAQRHGGSVRCLARDGGGACFEIEWPARPATAPMTT